MDEKIWSKLAWRNVINTASSISDIPHNDTFTMSEILQDIWNQAREKHQSFRELQSHYDFLKEANANQWDDVIMFTVM